MAFSGKGHHKHNYGVCPKASSLRTVSGSPLETFLSPANELDQAFILVPIETLLARYPYQFSYIILLKGCDTEEIYHDVAIAVRHVIRSVL